MSNCQRVPGTKWSVSRSRNVRPDFQRLSGYSEFEMANEADVAMADTADRATRRSEGDVEPSPGPSPETGKTESDFERSGYVSPNEFVRVSGLSLSTVRRYVKDGRLPKIQIGGPRCRVLIPLDAIEGSLQRSPEVTEEGQATLQASSETVSTISSNKSPHRRGPEPRWRERR